MLREVGEKIDMKRAEVNRLYARIQSIEKEVERLEDETLEQIKAGEWTDEDIVEAKEKALLNSQPYTKAA